MKILDRNGEEKKVKDLKRFVLKTKGADGKQKSVDYAEFMVVGENSTWKDSIKLDIFKKLNPNIKI